MMTEPHHLGYLLNKVTLLLKRELSKKLIANDITPSQWAVLQDLYMQEMLSEEERENTPAHIAERIFADRPTVSGILNRLSTKGLIQVRPNPADRRSQVISLTQEAKKLLPSLQNDAEAVLSQAVMGLPDEQLQPLTNALLSMIRNLELGETSQ